MIDVNFSIQSTGACPMCRRFQTCDILKEFEIVVQKTCAPVADSTMEIVVYRCPEFKEEV
jgi:hypothetical protein